MGEHKDTKSSSHPSQSMIQGLGEVAAYAKKDQKKLPPVHLWNPPYCGEIPLTIKRDGTWHYQNSPIGRKPMVRLFSTILRKDDDQKFYLVTPVEKCGIEVEDAPFLAVELTVTGGGRDQILCFRTNVDDEVIAGAGHEIRVSFDPESGEPAPYVHVRAGLEALIHRPVFYQLVDLGVIEPHAAEDWFGVWSGGQFFPMSLAKDLE